jgi:hypothetical protein
MKIIAQRGEVFNLSRQIYAPESSVRLKKRLTNGALL